MLQALKDIMDDDNINEQTNISGDVAQQQSGDNNHINSDIGLSLIHI